MKTTEDAIECINQLREQKQGVPLYQQVFDAIQYGRYPRHYADYAATHKGVSE